MNDALPAPLDVRLMNMIATILFVCCAVGVVSVGSWWFLRNPAFAIGHIVVHGDLTHTNPVSLRANVAPRLCADFAAACAAGDWTGALALHDRLFDLHKAMFSDASPGPVKYALSRVHDWFSPEVRLPIIPASEASRRAVDAALSAAGVI